MADTFINTLTEEEQDFFTAIFMDGTDMFTIYRNYQLALENYFYYFFLVSDLAEDIEDGLIVSSLSASNGIERMLISFKCCVYFKKLTGSEDPIIDPLGIYSIRNNSFSFKKIEGEKRIIEQGAQGFIRSFTRNQDYKDYELGVLALTILNSYLKEV